jgi:hypothetical protein
MKNKIDYLHLYLGCEVAVQGEERRGYLTGVTNGAHECEIQYQLADNPHHLEEEPEWANSEDVMLVLRPLSDMTEEERNGMPKSSMMITSQGLYYTPDLTHYLISKHFDLFGLIESGLAITKPTTP